MKPLAADGQDDPRHALCRRPLRREVLGSHMWAVPLLADVCVTALQHAGLRVVLQRVVRGGEGVCVCVCAASTAECVRPRQSIIERRGPEGVL